MTGSLTRLRSSGSLGRNFEPVLSSAVAHQSTTSGSRLTIRCFFAGVLRKHKSQLWAFLPPRHSAEIVGRQISRSKKRPRARPSSISTSRRRSGPVPGVRSRFYFRRVLRKTWFYSRRVVATSRHSVPGCRVATRVALRFLKTRRELNFATSKPRAIPQKVGFPRGF